jgi:tritrans,polycis-undecaprenyl-diphosphate synthase [geranylgeranyl-diphosphate specific]
MNNVPKHIGIILDGNRSFAKKLMMKPWKGHEWGKEKIEKLFEWCKEIGIPEMTLYTFSIQNFNRPKQEFDYLMKLFNNAFGDLMKEENKKKLEQIQIRFIGRTHMFPQEIQDKMKKLTERTASNTPYKINFAMAYGGREEVIDAVKRIADAVKKGELDYSEWFFLEKTWPEFEKEDLISVINEYSQRERRFGR